MRQFFSVILCAFLFSVYTQIVLGVEISCDKPVTQRDAHYGVVKVKVGNHYAGTGFVVHIYENHVYVLTAAHILKGVKGKNEKVEVAFYYPPGVFYLVEWVGEIDGIHDLAVLKVKINEKLKHLRPLPITKLPSKLKEAEGYIIGHAVGEKPWKSYPVKFIQNNFLTLSLLPKVQPGTGGAPLIQEGCVVGLVNRANKAISGKVLIEFLIANRVFSPTMPISSTTPTSDAPEIIHLVQRGETLGHIAGKYYDCDSQRCWVPILNANQQLKGFPKNLVPGMKIVIPPANPASSTMTQESSAHFSSSTLKHQLVHRVKIGDTLPDIAHQYYGTTYAPYWCYILDHNSGLLHGDATKLTIGMKLKIPPEPHPNNLPDCKK